MIVDHLLHTKQPPKHCESTRRASTLHQFSFFLSHQYAILEYGRALMPFTAISGHVEMAVKGITTLSSILVVTEIREVMVCYKNRATNRFPQSNKPPRRLFWSLRMM